MTHVPMCEWCGNHEAGAFSGGTERFCPAQCVYEHDAAYDDDVALFTAIKRIGEMAKAKGRDPIAAVRFQMDRAFEDFAWEVENAPDEEDV